MKKGRIPDGVKAGPGTYFGGAPKILWDHYGSKLTIGNYTSISAEVTFFLGGHHFIDRVTNSGRLMRNRDSSYSKGDIIVGNDVWICHGAIIMDGLTIGDGAVVGAFAVVASDVEPFSVVVGNPAKIVKYRFDEPTINSLLKMQWWNWPGKKIVEALPLLRSKDIGKFLKKYG